MHNLKDNNLKVYKIFSEGNLDIRWRVLIENGQDWHPIHLVMKQTINRFFRSNGDKNEVQVLKKLREEYDFSLCSLAQLLRRTNRCLSWDKWMMQELLEIMTVLEKLYDTYNKYHHLLKITAQ